MYCFRYDASEHAFRMDKMMYKINKGIGNV